MTDTAVRPDIAEDAAAVAGPPVAPARLRVLSGRLAGAEHRLPPERSITLGHSFENDVVLRGAGTAGLSAELHLGDDAAMLRVLTGSLVALGRELKAGEELLLPAYLPVRLGEFAFAVGGDDTARWSEAAELAASVARPIAADRARPRALIRERMGARADRWRRMAGRRGRALAVGAGALVATLLAFPAVDHWRGVQARDPAAVRAKLAAAGFGGLVVTRDPGGSGVLITGGVTDDAQAERLQAFAAAELPGSLVEVESAAALAAAASDVLRQSGVEAQATPVRPGVIAVTGDYLPGDKQVELTALLRRDIPALATVEYRTAPGRGSEELRHFFNSPRFGAASFVDGDPGFIVTGDGSRWFAGAVLPTGHRVLSVGRGQVTLERAGRTEILSM